MALSEKWKSTVNDAIKHRRSDWARRSLGDVRQSDEHGAQAVGDRRIQPGTFRP